MSSIKFFKVTSLPAVLEPNSVYLVNTAGILSMHISDRDGVNSFKLSDSGGMGGGTVPYLVRRDSPKIVGDTNGLALQMLSVITRRLYLIPFTSPRDINLINIRLRISGSGNSDVLLGVYDNTNLVNGNDNPFNLISPSLSTRITGMSDRIIPLTMTLQANTLYWFGIICSSAPNLFAVPLGGIQSSLGRFLTTTASVTHLFRDYGTFMLPALAPTDLTAGSGIIPAIYLGE